MTGMRALNSWLALGVLACAASAAPLPQPLSLTPSAQVTLEGSATAAGLTLRPRATVAGAPLNVTELSVAIDGASVTATRQADGSWIAPRGKAAGAGKLEVFVTHDGIREVLSGTLPAIAAGNAAAEGGSLLRDHKQMAWWILNIGIVLIAAIAISRRMG
jgi:hypothetical protein